MLLVTPASFWDILAGDLLVILVFKLAMNAVELVIPSDFSGAVLPAVLYMALCAFLSPPLELQVGSLFNSHHSAGTVPGIRLYPIVSGILHDR